MGVSTPPASSTISYLNQPATVCCNVLVKLLPAYIYIIVWTIAASATLLWSQTSKSIDTQINLLSSGFLPSPTVCLLPRSARAVLYCMIMITVISCNWTASSSYRLPSLCMHHRRRYVAHSFHPPYLYLILHLYNRHHVLTSFQVFALLLLLVVLGLGSDESSMFIISIPFPLSSSSLTLSVLISFSQL